MTRATTFLGVLIFLGSVLRLVSLADYPPALNWDEVSLGYNAQSILTTGHDEWGVVMPTIFRAYGDYKLPGYIYTLVPFIFTLGLNEFSVRLPSALAGILLIPVVFLLTKRLFGEREALIAALLITISPWTIFLSRIALEANLAILFLTAGIYFLFAQKIRPLKVVLGILFLGFSAWTYNSFRVFAPLILAYFFYLNRKIVVSPKSLKYFIVPFFVALVFFVPMFLQLVSSPGSARFKNVSIVDEGAVAYLEGKINERDYPWVITKLLYNKPIYFLGEFGKHYTAHFLPNFLFGNGAGHYQFSIPGQSMFYSVFYLFYLVGLFIVLFRAKKSSHHRLIIVWILLAPLAASVTKEAPHALRSIPLMPAIAIVIAIGVDESIRLLNKNKRLLTITTVFLSFICALQFFNFIHNYFSQYAKNYSWAWQYGYKEVAQFTQGNDSKYDAFVITKKYGEPHEFLLFYGKWDADRYIHDSNLIRYGQSNWFWVDRFDKYYFVNDWEILESGNRFVMESRKQEIDCDQIRCALITSPGNAPTGWNIVQTISFLDSQPAFEIYTNK